MLKTLKMQTVIFAEKALVWEAINHASFVKDFLPEIKSNQVNVLPAYVVPGDLLSWNATTNTTIELANKALNTNIESVELELQQLGGNTLLTFEVNLDPVLNSSFFAIHRAVKALFKMKLAVLKSDLEQKQIQVEWSPAYS